MFIAGKNDIEMNPALTLFKAHFGSITDPRDERGLHHRLMDVQAMAVMAIIRMVLTEVEKLAPAIEPGKFECFVGGNSRDVKKAAVRFYS